MGRRWCGVLIALGALGLSAPGCAESEVEGHEEPAPDTSNPDQPREDDVNLPSGDFSALVSRYEYGFDIRTGAAHASLYLDVPPPGGDCYVVNAPAGVSQVKWNGHTAGSVEVLDGALRICDQPLFAGQVRLEGRHTVAEQTYNYSQVGFSRRPDRGGNTFSYLLSWVESCDLFGPCDDAPDRLSHYAFTVTHDAGDVVLCPGTLSRPSSTTTRCELLGLNKAPTYSSFAIASNRAWTRKPFVTVGEDQLVFYEVPGGRLAASLNATAVANYVRWITQLLGPLPYGRELRIAGAPTDWLGLEHPANIILREDLPDMRREYADMTMHTLMHEIVHQWAGNRTTLSSAFDFAWKEAIAEYLAYVYEEHHRPEGEAAQTRAYWDRLARTATYYPKPQDDPAPIFLSFASDVYGTGPMLFFVQLEPLLGQQTILQGIQNFLALPGHRSVEQLRESLEQASGKQLGAYFDAWVYGSGDPDWPYFDVSTQAEDGQVTVTAIQQSFSGTRYPVSVDVLLKGETKEAKVTLNYGLSPTTDTLSVTVPFSEPVIQVVVDPENRVVNRRFFGAMKEPAPQRWQL